jgi:hypothetical protein
MQRIIIRGGTATGKGLLSLYFEKLARDNNLSVSVYDGELHVEHPKFDLTLARIIKEHDDSGVDVSIITIADPKSNLVVDFGNRGNNVLLRKML